MHKLSALRLHLYQFSPKGLDQLSILYMSLTSNFLLLHLLFLRPAQAAQQEFSRKGQDLCLNRFFSSSFDKGFGEFTALRILSSFLVFSHEYIEGPAVSVSLLVQSEL